MFVGYARTSTLEQDAGQGSRIKVCDPKLGISFGEVMAPEPLRNPAKDETSEPPGDPAQG